jgi:hypothetical protein
MMRPFPYWIPLLFLLGTGISCTTPKQGANIVNAHPKPGTRADTWHDSSFLENLMKDHPQYFEQVLKNRKEWNVQVIYTRVDRGEKGQVELKKFEFNVDPDHYFYPASTVKLPIVLLALQKLHQQNKKGVDLNTTMITEDLPGVQTAVYNDPSAPDGRPTIANYIRKILLVSDNDAFNRLYEFLGQEYINVQLHKLGYDDAQVLHRLNLFLPLEKNRMTNAVKFLDSNNVVLFEQPVQVSHLQFSKRNDHIGNAFYRGDRLVNAPMDFSEKNRISLDDLNDILVNLVCPGSQGPNKTFELTEEDKRFVFKYMSQFPTESIYPPYSSDSSYWPAYGKFLLWGATHEKPPPNIRIFNKEGDAYGHMLDVAYIVDFTHKIEFFLSAEIYCNTDGILNDDRYDYDTIGLPFLKHLGEVVYDYELKRDRKILPDLSGFIFRYDK